MKILQFAIDAREESAYLANPSTEKFLAYTGTHDNETISGWMENVAKADRDFTIDYHKLDRGDGYHWGFIRGVWSSTAYLAIAQMQDFLGLDNKSRMNFPSTLGGNWVWRISKHDLSHSLAKKMKHVTKLYGRL